MMAISRRLAGAGPGLLDPGLMHAHWRLFLGEGVLLIVLGFAAIGVPLFAGLAITVVLGWVLMIAGSVGLVATLKARHAPGFRWAAISGVLALAAGLVLLWTPLAGLVTLTYVLIAYFVADGVANILLGISYRSDMPGQWAWIMLNGVTDLALAGIILSGMPATLFWALGLLVGIDLLFGGVSLIVISSTARQDAGT